MKRHTLTHALTALIVVAIGLVVLPAPLFAQGDRPAAGPGVGEQAQGSAQAQKPETQKPEAQKPEAQKPEAQKPEQKPAEEQPLRMDTEVFVTAPRLEIPIKESPAATSVVGEPVLKRMSRGIGAEEALQGVPGVKVDNQADGQRVHLSIRGQGLLTERGIRGITVLLDGLPLNDPTGFAPDLFDVDWNAVRRVEVFRSVASTLYGGGSAGGIINIETRDGAAGSAKGEASVALGQYNFWKPFAEVGGTSGNVNYRASASYNHGDGYRTHTNFDGYNLYGKARWTPSANTQITAIVAGTHFFNQNAEGLNKAWVPGTPEMLYQPAPWATMANPDALTYNEYQQTSRVTTGVTGRTKLGANQDLSFAAWYRHTNWKEAVPSSVQHRGYDTPGFNAQYVLHSQAGGITNQLTLGTDMSWQGIGDSRYANLGNAVEGTDLLANQTISQRGVGLFALDRIDLTKQVSASFGVRYDDINNELTDVLNVGGVDLSGSASFSKPTGRAGLAWNPRPDFGLYTSIGQGFMPPATEELANNPEGMGGFNMNLVPATSLGEEVGVRGTAKAFSYDIAFFHLTTEKDFGRYRVPSRPLETFYGNVGTSRRYGLETEIGYYPTTSLAFRGAYTFSDFLYTDVQFMYDHYTDKVMPNAPRHQVAFDAEYKFGGNWVAGLNLFGQSMQYVNHVNDMTAEGYALTTPRIAYRLTRPGYQAEIMLSGRNVFGVDYMAFTEPDPDGNSYQPGPTAEAFLTVRISFGGK
jgi:iron complex outermembrane recepter protein